jgi:hypothetical protein
VQPVRYLITVKDVDRDRVEANEGVRIEVRAAKAELDGGMPRPWPSG